MANPNISNVNSIIGDTSYLNAGTSPGTVVSGEVDKVKKIGAIVAANYANTDQTITVFVLRSATNFFIANQITVPAKATVLLLGREHSFYLLEADALRAQASAGASITVTVSYETLSIV